MSPRERVAAVAAVLRTTAEEGIAQSMKLLEHAVRLEQLGRIASDDDAVKLAEVLRDEGLTAEQLETEAAELLGGVEITGKGGKA